MNLQDFAQKLTNQTDVMEGKEKGDLNAIKDNKVKVTDFDILSSNNGDYAVFAIEGDKDFFYFGGSVITDFLSKLEEAGFKEAVQDQGLEVILSDKDSKNGNTYTNIEPVK